MFVERRSLTRCIAWLLEHGYQPALPGDDWHRTPDGEPISLKRCAAMTQREHQGNVGHSYHLIAAERR